MPRKPETSPKDFLWPSVVAGTFIWLLVVGWHYWWRAILLTGLTFAAFMLGCAAAFVFTSYGEETNSIGKVKDWLVGGITTLTIVKLGSIKPLLLLFAASDSAADYALTVSTAIIYLALGFLFMFFQRELILNVLLAEGRAERGRLEGTRQAGEVALNLIAAIPPSLLAGQDNIEELTKRHKKDAKALKESLESDNVQKFLDQSELAVKEGLPLDWDVVSKVAYIHYYRTYFVSKADESAQLEDALAWIRRALVICPQHIDFTCKMAGIFAVQEDYAQAVSILEGLRRNSECPLYVDEWLGFYLLYFPGREDEAIHCSQAYLAHFPRSNEARRNLASAYAQRACLAAKANHGVLDHESSDYRRALEHAGAALEAKPDYASVMQTDWIAPGGSFHCFAKDHGYRKLVGLDQAAEKPAAHHEKKS